MSNTAPSLAMGVPAAEVATSDLPAVSAIAAKCSHNGQSNPRPAKVLPFTPWLYLEILG